MICKIFRHKTDDRMVADGETINFIAAATTEGVYNYLKYSRLSLRDYGYVTMSEEGVRAEIEKMEKQLRTLKSLTETAERCIKANGGMV